MCRPGASVPLGGPPPAAIEFRNPGRRAPAGCCIRPTLACRLWARIGYHQSGGALGFRDLLQDAMALTHTEPRHLHGQLLRCAGCRCREGDAALHWGHRPLARGVPTRCADDGLWLPLATCRCVPATGDTAVLHESTVLLDRRLIGREAGPYCDLLGRSDASASLYFAWRPLWSTRWIANNATTRGMYDISF